MSNCLNDEVKAKFFGFMKETITTHLDHITEFAIGILTEGLIDNKEPFEGYKFDIRIKEPNALWPREISLLLPVIDEKITDVYHFKGLEFVSKEKGEKTT